jgi:hypothetical protein
MDSGANIHVCVDASMFSSYQVRRSGALLMGNGSCAYVLGVGTIILKFTSGKTVSVGTLKLGYPLLLYKDAVPTRLSLSRVVKVLCVGPSHDSPRPRVTTLGPQQRLTPPHGRARSRHVSRESDIPQGLNSKSGPLDIQSGTPDPGCGKSEPPHTPVVLLLGAAAEDRR